MTNPSSSTAPLPNPQGQYIYSPKLQGQQSRVRQEISQYASSNVGIEIMAQNVYVDPDTIQVTIYQRTDFSTGSDPLGPYSVLPQEDLVREDVGIWSFIIDPSLTQTLSLVTVHWEYSVSGVGYDYWDYYEIREPMPTYDAFTDNEKGIIRLVAFMFEDLYDSVDGGPHLKEEFQTHFGTETLARCMELACHRINSTSQPYTQYNVGAGVGTHFPMSYYSILVTGTYLEVVRHLIRSYTEYAVMQGGPGVAYVDRSQYADRWRAILADEKDDFARAVRSFKRSLLGLGGGSLLVSGGIFGSSSYFRSGFSAAAARAGRFYPVSYVQVRGY